VAKSLFRRLRKRWRWLTGRGWSAEDFAQRYGGGGADAWGYRTSPQHRRRAEWIMEALPKERFRTALEVGCAQGFLTERLASRADRLIACDISPEAILQAKENCREFANVAFQVADIRAGFPGNGLDLCLFSDVLYYLSARELDAVLAEAAQRTAAGGYLLIVNEWSDRARGLTSPTRAFARLDADAQWERLDSLQSSFGETQLSMGIYRRKATGPAF
jgi:SAM-dependent methyltransferase